MLAGWRIVTPEAARSSRRTDAGCGDHTVDYLRLSVTDRCNFRCVYCMPPEGVPFKPHDEILSYEDMAFFVGCRRRGGHLEGAPHRRRAPGAQGSARPRAPARGDRGGRRHLADHERHAAASFAAELAEAGLSRVNISLDSLDPERYRLLTRGGSVERALAGVQRRARARPSSGEGQRRPDAGDVGRAGGLRRPDPGPTPPRALHRVDAGGGLRTAHDGRAARHEGRGSRAALRPRGRVRRRWRLPGDGDPLGTSGFAGHVGTIGFISSVSATTSATTATGFGSPPTARLKKLPLLRRRGRRARRPCVPATERPPWRAIRASWRARRSTSASLPGRSARGMSQIGG